MYEVHDKIRKTAKSRILNEYDCVLFEFIDVEGRIIHLSVILKSFILPINVFCDMM